TVITPDNLSPELRRAYLPSQGAATASGFGHASGLAASAANEAISQGLTLADATAELERRMIAEALRKHHGNISRAARELWPACVRRELENVHDSPADTAE